VNEDKATRYHRLKRRASLLGTGLGALFLFFLLITGSSASLRDVASAGAGSSFALTITIYVVFVVLLGEGVQLPFAFYHGVTLERRYGLSTQTTWRWWLDQAKGLALGLVFAVGASLLTWYLLRWSPERWWMIGALCFAVILVGLVQVAPVFLLPIFYELKPLARQELARRLVALAERAGAPVLGVFEWRLSDRTRKANAALTGIGRTRRILLSDTLLAEHSDDEIEVVLAHELAHHVHQDIWKGIGLEVALIGLGFYLSDHVLTFFAGRFGLLSKDDVAGFPLLVLTAGAVSILLMPLANALSRAHERRADRFALDLTKNASAFVSAMRRLGSQNLAEERPSRFVEVVFYSHPPMSARIAAAQAWPGGAPEGPPPTE
jgi:STE24 endopeptidase